MGKRENISFFFLVESDGNLIDVNFFYHIKTL